MYPPLMPYDEVPLNTCQFDPSLTTVTSWFLIVSLHCDKRSIVWLDVVFTMTGRESVAVGELVFLIVYWRPAMFTADGSVTEIIDDPDAKMMLSCPLIEPVAVMMRARVANEPDAVKVECIAEFPTPTLP